MFPWNSIQIKVTIIETKESFSACINNPTGDVSYEINIPIEHLNKEARVSAIWDHDLSSIEGCFMSIGDYWGFYNGLFGNPIVLALINDNIDFDLDNKVTASVKGEISCDEHTEGQLCVSVWDCEFSDLECLKGLIGCQPLSEPGQYTVLVSNVEPGNLVWASGGWYVNGICSGPQRSGDYTGT
jgi:hypothetical protein